MSKNNITVQLLVSTMNQTDHSLLEKMNIFTDTIVINQCDRTNKEIFSFNGNTVEWYDCDERGVGRSRNTALMRSTADVCVFADDMVYKDDTLDIIRNAFLKRQDADLIVFNVNINGFPAIKKTFRLNWGNAFKYGTVQVAVRRAPLFYNRISFSLLFGGGAKYSCGEDTLFFADCLKHRLRLYAVTDVLGTNTCGKSTWFQGYTEKFFEDKGALFAALSPRLARLYSLRFVIRQKNKFDDVSMETAYGWMKNGIKLYKRRGNRKERYLCGRILS